ncbi:pentatricopeptide repeat-containing protein At3g02330, mitochondrial [Cynara cardunculus var. scolymus]|uniref:pentatricopeptide repeat-containing protein At3g02330, mitochondrial n=1 Tax=Cynara cardunculus var. scolymus TaxID=59895 RepID=UPI000D630A40|nr:pentatricopeptide repeat-containing protein At3g02330, mitochondrial [Cynara cardunculus var. scolymus]
MFKPLIHSHLCFTRIIIPFSPKQYSTQIHTVGSFFNPKPLTSFVKRTFSHIYQQCSHQKALDHGKEAHAHMIVSGFLPTVFVTNCLIQMYIKCSNLEYAHKVFDRMPQRDTVSWNAMVFGYAGSGCMSMAQMMFNLMPQRDVVSWNSLISGYLQNGSCWKSIEVFMQIQREGVGLDATTFAVVLKACLGLEDYGLGVQIHGLVVRMGFVHDVVAGSATVDMYAKCKKLKESLSFFDEMPVKNWVSWSALIAGCVQNDEFLGGLKLFKNMQKNGFGVSQSTYASVFRSCAGLSALRFGSQLHAHSLKMNFGSDTIVGTATLDMYAKCGRLCDAKTLFRTLSIHNRQSYNAIIIGCARVDQGFKALQLFHDLINTDLGFDDITLSGAFSACAVIKAYMFGVQLHGLTIKSMFCSNVCVENAILDMYGKCGALCEARWVFDEMEIRDAVSWNAIIAAYEQNGNVDETLHLLVWMLSSGMEPDEFTFGSVLKACAGLQVLNYGMEIHGRILKSGMGLEPFVGSTLVDMYCKCAKVEDAEKLHERMKEQTMVSWNAIISGFSNQEEGELAQRFFSQMLETGTKPDNFTFATVLDTCANLATVNLGRQVHAQIIKQEMQSDVFICSTLVDMYSKCGNMQDSRLMFEKSPNRDFVTWNAMICGYAHHGLGNDAITLFESMKLNNVKPNHATFVSVLRACAHVGLVEKGLQYFNTMLSDYGLKPQLEHYACMVDILGRSGQVNKALKLINEMPVEADDVIWRSLLGICKLQRNVDVAEEAASSLLRLDPQDSSAYVLLANIYADVGMWEEMSKIRKKMRNIGLKKEPGCSWIEVKSELHMFTIGDKAHPRCKDIYEKLDELTREMAFNDEEVQEEQQDLRFVFTETTALLFGIEDMSVY